MKEKVLITGGAGFIGSHLALQLLEKGYEVVVLDNLSPQIHGDDPEKTSQLYLSIKDRVTFILGDVCNRNDWAAVLAGVNIVVHLAAETGTGQSMYQVEKYYEVNVQGTALLFDILVNEPHQVKKIVIASSRSIYGEGKYKSTTLGILYPEKRDDDKMRAGIFELLSPDTGEIMECLPTDEASKLHPSSIYGLTKLAQEQLVMLMGAQLNISATALRFQNVYGPGQSLANPYTGLLAVFSNRIRGGSTIEIYEDGKESRDFVYISDVVSSIAACIENRGADNKIFNVGSGVSTSILEVAEMMQQCFEKSIDVKVTGKYRVGDIRHNYADISLIRSSIGFEPAIPFSDGIKNFVNWALKQEQVKDRYDESIQEIMAKGMMK